MYDFYLDFALITGQAKSSLPYKSDELRFNKNIAQMNFTRLNLKYKKYAQNKTYN